MKRTTKRTEVMRARLAISMSAFLIGSIAWAQTGVSKGPPFVIVQVVDATWSPLPGVDVVLRERFGKRATFRETTNADGLANFWFAPPVSTQRYDIRASAEGFTNGEMTDVNFGVCYGDCKSSRHVQIRISVAGNR
jgi:hypothetical protein